MSYKTEQEEFWAGEFGTEYISRNDSDQILASNIHLFSNAFKQAGAISSCLELGANIGMNLRAIRVLYPGINLNAVEINPDAVKRLSDLIGGKNVFHGSIFEYPVKEQFDVSMIKGVLIHINPELLSTVYEKLYAASSRFIFICEYYNPSPVSIQYRGQKDRLFKRDFVGEMMDMYPDLSLIDYGFSYHRDAAFPQDDATWFLLRKS